MLSRAHGRTALLLRHFIPDDCGAPPIPDPYGRVDNILFCLSSYTIDQQPHTRPCRQRTLLTVAATMGLDSPSIVAIVEIAVFVPAIIVSFFVCLRHGFSRSSG